MNQPKTDRRNKANRGTDGRFQKGKITSPSRWPGRSADAELRQKLMQELHEMICVLHKRALAGDPRSIRILRDCVLPFLGLAEPPTQLDLPLSKSGAT